MKNALIAGVVGLLFMAGGFYAGFKMMPPIKPAPVVVIAPTTVTPPGAAVPMPTPEAISMDALKKTSQSMMSLNLALANREKQVEEREARAKQEEDEIAAERQALDASHEKFKALFNDFQNRLQLVEANQMEQLQKQAELYTAMGPDQSIDLLRTMDDNALARLFSVMETKPLAKIVGTWKTKYPDDAPRLLRTLANTAQVIDKNKVAINDPLTAPVVPESAAPAAPASAPDATSAASPAPAPSETPAPAPDAAMPAPSDSQPPAPAPSAATPDATAPGDAAPLAPPPDAPALKAPAQKSEPATTDDTPAPTVAPDTNTPGAIAEALTLPQNSTAMPAGTIDPGTVPVAQPASPSDLGVEATDLQPRRAKPVNVTTATTN